MHVSAFFPLARAQEWTGEILPFPVVFLMWLTPRALEVSQDILLSHSFATKEVLSRVCIASCSISNGWLGATAAKPAAPDSLMVAITPASAAAQDTEPSYYASVICQNFRAKSILLQHHQSYCSLEKESSSLCSDLKKWASHSRHIFYD